MVDFTGVIPKGPSGFHKPCRAALSMAVDAASLGKSALVPPVAGAVSAAVNAGHAALNNLIEGHVGAAAGALAAGIPAAAAGFFGGGAAADVVQGATNQALSAAGANTDNLPNSDSRNLAQDATCVKEPEASKGPTVLHPGPAVPPGYKSPPLTAKEQAYMRRVQMPGLY